MLPGCSVLTMCVMNRRWPCLVPWTVSFIALIDDAKKTDVSLKSKDGQKYNFSFGEWHGVAALTPRLRIAECEMRCQQCGNVAAWLVRGLVVSLPGCQIACLGRRRARRKCTTTPPRKF